MIEPALTHGWTGLLLGYATVQVPMIAGLIRNHASARDYLLAPVAGAPLTVAAAGGIALIRALIPAYGLLAVPGMQLALGATISGVIGYAGGFMIARGGGEGRIHQRGTVISGKLPRESPRNRRRSRANGLSLAGLPVPYADEAKHFKMIGTTGTGKSTAIRELMNGALVRGDRAVIADPDGGYLRQFHDASRGDIVLNPFDARSVRWDLFGEIENAYDVEQLARALIPDHEGPDRSWRAYARTFFTAVTRQLSEAGTKDIAELYRLLVVADSAELRTLVRGTPAQPFLDEHNIRMFDSIRSVTASAIGSLDHIAQQDAVPLSVRRWIRDESAGVLFVPYQAGQIAALRSTISAWMRLAIFETMNASEDENHGIDRPIWFVVDELDALGQIDGLKDALARIRKFGGRCVLGFQSVAQVSTTYGQGDAHTLVENCGNTLILRCSASEGGGTARFASQLVGEREVLRRTVATSRRFNELAGSKTCSEHYSVEAALLPSEIEQLPDMTGYVKLASMAHWQRIELAQPVLRATPRADTGPAVTRSRAQREQAHDSWGLE